MQEKYANYILNKTVEDYNKISDKYSSVREKDWKEMGFLFEKYLFPNELVLDLGCGNGRFHNLFKERGVEYFGVDPSEKLIDIAKSRHPNAYFKVASGMNIPFDNDYFDKIFSIAVLHHIPSHHLRLEFLKEARRALKTGGNIILTVWNLKEKMNQGSGFKNWLKRWQMDKGDILLPWYGSKDTYFHCFTLEELVDLTIEAGFDIIEQREILVGERPYSNFCVIGKK